MKLLSLLKRDPILNFIIHILIIICSVFFILNLTKISILADHKKHHHHSSDQQKITGKGVIHQIDFKHKKVNLTHEQIPQLN